MSDYRTGDRTYSELSSSSYRRSGGYDDRDDKYDRDYGRGGAGDYDRGSSYSKREEYRDDGYGGGRGAESESYYKKETSRRDEYDDRGADSYKRSEHYSRGDNRDDKYAASRGDSYGRTETYKESDRQVRSDSRTRSDSAKREEREKRETYGGRDDGLGYKEQVITTSTTVDRGTYRPIVTPRSVVIQRTGYGMAPTYGSSRGSRGYSVERTIQYGSGLRGGFAPETYGAMTHSNVSSMMESREKEKRDMQDLNERFASYIEKVRFLEAQNRRLADELEKLRASWGKETSAVKAMYQTEMEEARRLLDDSERNKSKLEIRLASLEEQLDELRQKENDSKRDADQWRDRAEKLNQQLSDREAEISLLRRRVEGFEVDKDKEKKQIAYLTDALNRARLDLDNETLQHVDAENRRQTLEEELEFLKTIHEQEMRELAALAYRDTTPENREFWKNEMGQALREIQQVYDDKLDNIRGEMEFFYNTKIQEFTTSANRQGPGLDVSRSKEESKKMRTYMTELNEKMSSLDGRNAQLVRELETMRRDRDEREREWERENGDLKVEVVKLRAELEAILKELQNIMNAKMGLELEIEAYRKLLEVEETRLSRRGITEGTFFDDKKYPGGGGTTDKYGERDRYDGRRDGSGDRGGKDYGRKDPPYGGGGTTGGRTDVKPGTDRDVKPTYVDRDVKPLPTDKDGKPISDIAGRGPSDGGGRGGGTVARGGGTTARGGGAAGESAGRGGGVIGGDTHKPVEPAHGGGVVKPDVPLPDTSGRGGGVTGRGGGTAGDSTGRGGGTTGEATGRGGAAAGRGAYVGGRGGTYTGGRGGSYTGGRGGSTAVVEPKIQPKIDPKTQATPWDEEELKYEHQPPAERTPSRTSFQRSSKGPVSVAECAPDGKFITLENTGQKDEFIGGWMLSRVVDDQEKMSTVFPSDLVLRSGDKIRIWARGTKPLNASALDIEANIRNWGVGANAATKLTNMAGDERATHVQKTTY